MKSDQFHISRERPVVLRATCWRRVSLISGAVTGWTTGSRVDLPSVFALARRERTSLSYPAAEPLERLPETLPPMLQAFGVRPDRVELSLSAHRLACCSIDTLLALSQLRDLGIGLALVGLRGHQLNLLSRLPLTAAILDATLVACLPNCPEALEEVRSMAIAAQTLDVQVVAAGIETEAQRTLLLQLGITHGEGELFAER